MASGDTTHKSFQNILFLFFWYKETFFFSVGVIKKAKVMDSLNFDNLIICLIEYLFHHNPNCARDTAQVMVVTGLAHTNSS